MEIFAHITWNPNPVIDLGILQLRWYALLFVSGLWSAYAIIYLLFKKKNIPIENLQTLWLLCVVSAVVGARLGEVLFYEPAYYWAHPADIVKIWKGGLASHGATFVLFVTIGGYAYYGMKKPFFWLGDFVVSGIAMAAAFVRFGNFMNAEIVGRVSDVSWAMIFPTFDNSPRHPVQLYEGVFYVFLSAALFYLFPKYKDKEGFLSGLFLLGMFGTRFLLEFFKQNNSDLTEGFALTMGQVLSIPLALLGLWLMLRPIKYA